MAPLTRRQKNSLNYWKGSEARREEEQERAEVRRELGLLAEEMFREFQQVWSSTSQPDLASLAQCETLLDLALQSDWRAELRRRQGGRLEEALEDAVKWRKRTIMEESKGQLSCWSSPSSWHGETLPGRVCPGEGREEGLVQPGAGGGGTGSARPGCSSAAALPARRSGGGGGQERPPGRRSRSG